MDITMENLSLTDLAAVEGALILAEIAVVGKEYASTVSMLVLLRDSFEVADDSDDADVLDVLDEIEDLITEGEALAADQYDEYLRLSQELINIVEGPLNLGKLDREYR